MTWCLSKDVRNEQVLVAFRGHLPFHLMFCVISMHMQGTVSRWHADKLAEVKCGCHLIDHGLSIPALTGIEPVSQHLEVWMNEHA